MHSDKKITKEDTWKPAELRRHIRDGAYEEDRVRRREENERKHGGGETVERRHRDPDKEHRRDKDRDGHRHRERDHTRERDKQKDEENTPYIDNTRERDKRKDEEHNPYLDRRKEGSRDRRPEGEERDKEKRRDRERVADPAKHSDERGEHRDRRHHREEKETQDRERDRQKEKERRRERERDDDHRRLNREGKENQDRERDGQKEKERRRERERDDDHGRDRDKRREERDRERRREERDREHGKERDRKRHEESEVTGRDGERRRDREQRDREKENLNEGDKQQRHESRDKERRERHADRRHSEHKEEQVYKEDRQKEKEDRERRHKERGHHDEKRKHDSESREQRDGHHRGDGDRRDRDKHRERRHREEADPGPDETSAPKPYQDPRDKTTSSKIKEVVILAEPQTTIPADLEETEEPVGKDEELAEVQDYGDQGYEDDFEDYEDDFEEAEESGGEGEDEEPPSHSPVASGEGEKPTPQRSEEIKAIRRAMDEENERVGTAQSTQSTDQDRHTQSREARDKNQRRGSQRGKFINFVAAKQREVSKQVANKQKKRSAELLRLIDLDFSSTFSLLDLPPVSEYDMYIKSFGNTNTKQAYVQCNEDNVDRDIQTEDIEMSEKWTQHPAERHGPCGDPKLSQDARDKSTSEMNIDTQRLTAFLQSASQVMVVLLEEDYAEKQSLKRLSSKAEILSFSDGSLHFNTKLSFLNGRRVSLMHFSPVQNQTMMSVHSPTGKPGAVRLDTWTMICIWNIWEPSRPQKILVYESEVQCCCFSPGKATLVFAGTSVGSVLLWDLREHASNHYNLKVEEDEWTFRHPTFSTDAVLAASGHLSSVCCVEVVPSAVAGGLRPEAPLLASDEESSGLSFQLASLDANGVLNQWVVVELPKASDAGSQTDLGLRPGGKVKLLHSSTQILAAERTSPQDAMNTGSFQTLLLRFLPTDSNHFFIGTNMGVVNHGTSHGLKAPPKLYRSQVVGVRPTDVTSIHFSPFSPALFLVGCGDGSVRLHAASQEEPVLEWNNTTASEPVVSVQWTQTRPTVFCVLDAASNLYIWDLQKNDLEPAVTERIHADRVTAMAVFGDSGQRNTYSGVALAHESGKLEVQYFNERFTIPSAAEPEKLESMINDAF